MSSGMNIAEAEEIAKKMTFRDAVYNALRGRCVPYKKATRIKLNELLEMLDKRGKWVKEIPSPYEPYRCSICGGVGCNWYKFCKDCGARMEEIESEGKK